MFHSLFNDSLIKVLFLLLLIFYCDKWNSYEQLYSNIWVDISFCRAAGSHNECYWMGDWFLFHVWFFNFLRILYIMFVHFHTSPPITQRSIPPQPYTHPALCSNCYVYTLRYMAIHWNMINITGTTSLKKNYQLPISPQPGVWLPDQFPIHVGISSGLWLYTSCIFSHNYCEFMWSLYTENYVLIVTYYL